MRFAVARNCSLTSQYSQLRIPSPLHACISEKRKARKVNLTRHCLDLKLNFMSDLYRIVLIYGLRDDRDDVEIQ
jgi:hypothetical protein